MFAKLVIFLLAILICVFVYVYFYMYWPFETVSHKLASDSLCRPVQPLICNLPASAFQVRGLQVCKLYFPALIITFKTICHFLFNNYFYLITVISLADEFKGHSLLQAAREADLAKVKKTLALEIINFKQPQSHETALVRGHYPCIPGQSVGNSGQH